MTAPRATLRLQLHKGFSFDDAARIATYMARLGVSHLYASPILTARPGSMHGYDVVDPTRVNPELGGEAAFRRMVAALRAEDLGLIADIVPNHMAVGNANPWWQDVLRHGIASRHARVFDIDWHPDNPLLQGKVLLPVLGSQYGEALDAGELRLARVGDGWDVRYFDNRFPIAPTDRAEIERLGEAAYDPADPESRARLHRLLERQHYRLAWWRTAADEINWRRFFDINELAGVRAEDPDVFEVIHATLFRLYAEGLIDGVRVDHIDGLSDPRGYCRRLRARLHELAPDREAYFVVEKILGGGETLAADWEVDGTTGYDFMDAVSAVQHDPDAAEALSTLWASLTGRPGDFMQEAVPARREILTGSFTAQLWATAGALHRVALLHPETRDASRPALQRALIALLAHFPVYRSYPIGEATLQGDDAAFEQALAGARGAAARPELLALIRDWLHAPATQAHRLAARQFQQLSAPLAAKAIEDTAFYRYGRLLSRNDVGFDAALLGTAPSAFHAQAAARRKQFPDAMLATATHDHKRGEDVRARLAVLSEIPAEWGEILRRWMELNARHRGKAGGAPAPSSADEIMLYETIVGAWPMTIDRHERNDLLNRLVAWQEKALREAKLHTSWSAPNEPYESAARAFLEAILAESSRFPSEVAAFVDRIAAAGAVNGIAQALLKLTMPGVPDFYQGTDFWDLSLVDPDNRRPVDFAARSHALEADRSPVELAATWPDGRVKQAVIARTLALRRRLPALFARGDYIPLTAAGPLALHVIAFARRHQNATLIAVVPRLPLALLVEHRSILVSPAAWRDTALALPESLAGSFRDVIGGGELRVTARLALSAVLARFPAALLVSGARN